MIGTIIQNHAKISEIYQKVNNNTKCYEKSINNNAKGR